MEVSALERASRGFRVLEVPLHNDVPTHYNLADGLAVPGYVHKLIARCFRGINDTDWGRSGKSMSLPSGKPGPLGKRKSKPGRSGVIASERPIGLTVVCKVAQNDGPRRTEGTYVKP